MYFSVQRSVIEQFSFNGKKVHSVHVRGEECLVSRDVYMAIGYEEVNGKKTIQNLVPRKCKLRFGDLLNQREEIFPLHEDIVLLLKEPGLYSLLLRCKRNEAEPFLEWVVETFLPGEVRKLASAIEEKDAVITLMNDDLQDCDNQIQAIRYENVALKAQRYVHQAQPQCRSCERSR